MSEVLKSSNIKAILWGIGGIVAILLAFGFGVAVGYRRAIFASQFGENYYRNFYGTPSGQPPVAGMMSPAPFTMHGVTGQVLDVLSSTISVKDPAGNERSIVVMPNTPIREMDNYITIDDVKTGENITVIGEPNSVGQIQAKFIRIFGASSSLPDQEYLYIKNQ